ALLDQLHRLKLELSRKLPSFHGLPPVSIKTPNSVSSKPAAAHNVLPGFNVGTVGTCDPCNAIEQELRRYWLSCDQICAGVARRGNAVKLRVAGENQNRHEASWAVFQPANPADHFTAKHIRELCFENTQIEAIAQKAIGCFFPRVHQRARLRAEASHDL
ncbi:MAG: hypothetical protein WCA78_00835, partial [Rhizomicrobium sp.]